LGIPPKGLVRAIRCRSAENEYMANYFAL